MPFLWKDLLCGINRGYEYVRPSEALQGEKKSQLGHKPCEEKQQKTEKSKTCLLGPYQTVKR